MSHLSLGSLMETDSQSFPPTTPTMAKTSPESSSSSTSTFTRLTPKREISSLSRSSMERLPTRSCGHPRDDTLRLPRLHHLPSLTLNSGILTSPLMITQTKRRLILEQTSKCSVLVNTMVLPISNGIHLVDTLPPTPLLGDKA